MSRQTNILSFDEAKRDVRAYRSSVAMPDRAFLDVPSDLGSFQSPFRQASGRASSARTAASASLVGVEVRAGTMLGSPSRRVESSARGPRSAGAARGGVSRRAAASVRPPVAPVRSRGVQDAPQEDGDENLRSGSRTSRFQEFKRSRAKDKAERAFMKQFGGADKAAGASAAGPRAAVYKGEMGAKHRQAARMQNEASGRSKAGFGFSLSGLLSLKSSPKFIVSSAVAACLVLSCAFLYPSAQQYYHAVRENDRLQVEYAALEQRNQALDADVASLQTDAGVEARAHQQLGWVKSGEQTASVSGLDLDDSSSSSSNFQANIVSGDIKAPETWYSPFLDAVFGVE